MPWLLKGDTGDRVIMGLDMLDRLSCKMQQNIITQVGETWEDVGFSPADQDVLLKMKNRTTGGFMIKIKNI